MTCMSEPGQDGRRTERFAAMCTTTADGVAACDDATPTEGSNR
jgi:hypothetical protein